MGYFSECEADAHPGHLKLCFTVLWRLHLSYSPNSLYVLLPMRMSKKLSPSRGVDKADSASLMRWIEALSASIQSPSPIVISLQARKLPNAEDTKATSKAHWAIRGLYHISPWMTYRALGLYSIPAAAGGISVAMRQLNHGCLA